MLIRPTPAAADRRPRGRRPARGQHGRGGGDLAAVTAGPALTSAARRRYLRRRRCTEPARGAPVTGQPDRSPVRSGSRRTCCGSTPCWPTGNAAPCSARAATSSGCARRAGTATRCSPRCSAGRAGTRSPRSDRFVWGGYYEEGTHDLAQPLGHRPRHHRMPGSPGLPRRPAPRGPAAPGHRRRRGRHGPDHPGPTGRFRPAPPHPAAPRGRHAGPAGSGPLHLRWTGAPASTRPSTGTTA